MPISSAENIVRAICSDKYDGERISPSLFKGQNTSVSRVSVIPVEDHWEIFRSHVQKPPERWLELIGEINMGGLQQIGNAHNPAISLTVEPKPEAWNPAHAEIPEKITRGLSSRIVDHLIKHHPPAGFGETNKANFSD